MFPAKYAEVSRTKARRCRSPGSETSVQELNQRPRRCLNGRCACAVFYEATQRLR